MGAITGRRATKVAALSALIARGDIIEINKRQPKTKWWFVWTPDRASDAGIPARPKNLFGEDS
jgi:hypothetical protein